MAWLQYADMADRKEFVRSAHDQATLALYGAPSSGVARRVSGHDGPEAETGWG